MTNWPEFDEHPQSVLVAVDGSGNRTYHVSLDEQQYNQARDAIAAMQWRPMSEAPLHTPILMDCKHGAIEGQFDGEVGHGYYWTDLSCYPRRWMPLPQQPTGDL